MHLNPALIAEWALPACKLSPLVAANCWQHASQPCPWLLQDAGFQQAFQPIRVKFKPSAKDVQVCEESGTDIAQAVRKKARKVQRQAGSGSGKSGEPGLACEPSKHASDCFGAVFHGVGMPCVAGGVMSQGLQADGRSTACRKLVDTCRALSCTRAAAGAAHGFMCRFTGTQASAGTSASLCVTKCACACRRGPGGSHRTPCGRSLCGDWPGR